MNLLISLLDSKVVVILESHISLSWKIQSMLTYTLRFPIPPVNFLALEVTIVLCGKCLSFRLYIQEFLVLMTTSPHKTTCTQFCEHRPPPHWSWHQKMFTIWMTFVYSPCATKQATSTHNWAQKKSRGLSHSCICCKHDRHWQIEPCDIYKSLCPKCFRRWLPTNYVWWFANRMAWMTPDVFKSWTMSLNVHFISQKWKVVLIVGDHATQSLDHVERGESFCFSTLQLSNIIISF